MMPPRLPLILASASPTRARLLRNAAVPFEAVPAAIDEDAVKVEFASSSPARVAAILAERKAAAVSAGAPGRLVIGADQVLELGGQALSKPGNRSEARRQLESLSGRPHDQISCVCAVRDGTVLWHYGDRTTLWVRDLTEDFMDRYLDDVGDVALEGPGAYRIEGLGAQLFDRIDGDFFTVLGLPLLPLLGFLRAQGVLAS